MTLAWMAPYMLSGAGSVGDAARMVHDGWLHVDGRQITGWQSGYLFVLGLQPGIGEELRAAWDYSRRDSCTHVVRGGVAQEI